VLCRPAEVIDVDGADVVDVDGADVVVVGVAVVVVDVSVEKNQLIWFII
jgi:hypothetical protein